jgi:hypothetical protein
MTMDSSTANLAELLRHPDTPARKQPSIPNSEAA